MLRIAIADDHPLFRDAIRLALNDLDAKEGLDLIEAATAEEAMNLVDTNPDLDLLLLDLRMPGMNGLGGLVDLRRQHPSLPIVIVSASDDARTMRECLALGAMGFVPKSYEKATMTSAIQHVLEGRVHQPPDMLMAVMSGDSDDDADQQSVALAVSSLTQQQLRVLKAIAQGKPNKIIAYELGIAEKTVKAHVTEIFKKLDVTNRTQAVLAIKHLFEA